LPLTPDHTTEQFERRQSKQIKSGVYPSCGSLVSFQQACLLYARKSRQAVARGDKKNSQSDLFGRGNNDTTKNTLPSPRNKLRLRQRAGRSILYSQTIILTSTSGLVKTCQVSKNHPSIGRHRRHCRGLSCWTPPGGRSGDGPKTHRYVFLHYFTIFSRHLVFHIWVAIFQGPPSPTWQQPPAGSILPTASTAVAAVANEPPEATSGTTYTTTIANLPTRGRGANSPCNESSSVDDDDDDDDGKDPPYCSSSAHCETTTAYYEGSCDLWCPEDEECLSPLHCFLRKYCVEAITAKVSDISTPKFGRSPGRTISIDQVRAFHTSVSIL
jgi:hypothetical protein